MSVICLTGCDPKERPVAQSAEGASAGEREVPANQSDAEGTNTELRILSWNVESDGSDPATIAAQLQEFEGFDIVALSEVLPAAAEQFQEAMGEGYDGIVTRSGYNDRLQILFNTERFELLRRLELDEINDDRHRSPLVAHLHDKRTDQEILLMNNHLARGNAEYRTTQAKQLVEWARQQAIPIVAVGDYNFDYEFKDETGNDGFRAMLSDNIFQWVKPEKMIDSNWYDPEPDGQDNYPGSLLDFAFVAGPATEWKAVCNVIVRPDDFPDDKTTSDHRPFELILDH
ncbi:MAG: endonuclease/exonuclease/phosphatase family protein [Mariniblastus sp.]|nr:endonuclease/exonuclease/phosphatase family protein [Mariniblastus sp.]